MKTLKRNSVWAALAWLFTLAAAPALAQSQNSTATNWLRLGLRETDPQRKIAAYRNALALDPNFTEALYNLGAAYNEARDYRSAEPLLQRAGAATADKARKTQILYELARTQRGLNKTREYETTLREVKKLMSTAEQKSGVALELGRFLYAQGRSDEALAELRAGQNLNASQRGEFEALIKTIGAQGELQRLYDLAERARAGGNLKEAKSAFEQIAAQQADYRDVAAKLTALNAQLETETKRASLGAMYDQAQKYENESKPELAVSIYENILQQNENYRDARARLESVRQQLRQNQLERDLEDAYNAGVAAQRGRNWTQAIRFYERVLELDRNYRDARKRLIEAQSSLERESTDAIAARYYADGVAAMNQGDRGAALAAFERVRRLSRNYRDVVKRIGEIEAELQGQTEKAETTAVIVNPAPEASSLSPAKTDSLYQEALAAMDDENWLQAVIALEKLQLVRPNYRDSINLLVRARVKLEKEKAADDAGIFAGERTMLTYAGALAALFAAALAFIGLSPTARA